MPFPDPEPAVVAYLTRRFDLPATSGRLTPAARGAMGRIWRLELAGPRSPDADSSRTYAVKERFWPTNAESERAAQLETEFLGAAIAAGIRAPANLPTIDGHYIEQLPDELGGVSVRMYTWVDGRPLRPAEPGRAAWLGATLGTVHDLRWPTNDVPGRWFVTPPPVERWSELAKRARTADVPWAEALERQVPQMVALTESIASSGSGADPDLLCSHRDIQPTNVLIDSATGEFVLLDWEAAGPIDPSQELASRLTTWHMHDGAVDADGIRETMRAYRDAGGIGDVVGLESFRVGITGGLNYLGGQIGEALDSADPSMRTHAEREVLGLLAELPVPADFEAIAAAARSA